MQDLRLVAANESGTHLVLRSQVGEKYLLAIDERLRAAVRGDRARLGQLEIQTDGQLRPRDIQAQIRAGATAEQVAAAAGVPVDRVRRFEGPVLAEREHMAQMAQRGAIRKPGQVDGRGATLGDAVASRMDPLKIKPDELGWDSWRRDDGRWLVQLTYDHEDETRRARFVFDFRARTIAPEDEEARWLVGDLDQRPKRAPFVPRIAAAPGAEQPPVGAPVGIPAAAIRGDHPAGRKLPDAPPSRRADGTAARLTGALSPEPPVKPAEAPARPVPDVTARPAAEVALRPAAPAPPAGARRSAPSPKDAARPAATPPAARAGVPAVPPTTVEQPRPSARPDAGAKATVPAAPAAERPRRVAPLDFLVPPVPGSPETPPPPRRESSPRQSVRRPGIRSDGLGPRTQRRSVLDVPAAAPAASVAEADPVEHRRTGTHDARPASTGGHRRRASVPSWDDIMFGTRRRD